MLGLILSIILVIGGLYVGVRKPWSLPPINVENRAVSDDEKVWRALLNFTPKLGWLSVIAGVAIFISQSIVYIGEDEVGVKHRIYGTPLPAGKIIATGTQKGPQADVLGPGFNISPFINVIYDIEKLPILNIPEGKLGMLIAKDGLPLPDNTYMAPEWPADKVTKMLDAEYFLGEGRGYRGPQVTVLKPGKYRINWKLFDVKIADSTDVPAGTVAVIRSTVSSSDKCASEEKFQKGSTNDRIGTMLVSKGCRGVWKEVLYPSRYYLNPNAYEPILIPTRVQTWVYKGGYETRKIDLVVGDDGKITQKETKIKAKVPANAADRAIMVRSEGWTFPVEVRVVVQVDAQDAPLVVASVGDLQAVEDRIVTPAIRDAMRTIAGDPKRKVLDFVEKRDEIAALVENAIAAEAKKAGVTVQEVRLGEAAIPPELMVARLREQLATQLKRTYETEREAQKARIKTEKERATADKQQTLVAAEIDKQAAEFRKEQLRLQGEGEKLRLMEIAKGQRAQADVLGKENTVQLQIVQQVLAAVANHPEMVKYPNVLVDGSSGNGLEGAAAILGHSNISKMLSNTKKALNPKTAP